MLNPRPADLNHKQFQKLRSNGHSRKTKLSPITEAEQERWFSFNSFLDLMGLATLNQEDSGGLYALHAHINHSCEPNLMVSSVDKLYLTSRLGIYRNLSPHPVPTLYHVIHHRRTLQASAEPQI